MDMLCKGYLCNFGRFSFLGIEGIEEKAMDSNARGNTQELWARKAVIRTIMLVRV